MHTLLNIVAWVIAILIVLITFAWLFMVWSATKLHKFYGAQRKTEKENIVRNVRIDNIED